MLETNLNTKRSTQSKMLKTMVLFGDPRLPDPVKRNGQFNKEDFDELNSLKDKLQRLPGYDLEFHDNHQTLIKDLIEKKPDFVINFCDEGFNNIGTQELHVPALLELLGLPYTGAGPNCLSLCYDKAAVRGIARSLNIPVPEEIYVAPNAPIPEIKQFPIIIKPNFGDGSYGITQNGIVYNQDAFIQSFNKIRAQLPNAPLLIQQFLTGNEYTIPVIGNPGKLEFLPILHIDFSNLPKDLPPFLAHESKWDPTSPYWHGTEFRIAQLSPTLQEQFVHYASMLFERLGCRDFARFDFRLDEKGNPYLLEANPNPGLNWLVVEDEADEQLIGKIIMAARERYGLI